MSTVPALDLVIDILDTDLVMITHSNGSSYKMTGADINKRNQVIIANSKTITGTPLKTGNVVRVLFTADITAANGSTALAITYNSVNYTVKVCKNGALADYLPFLIESTYKYCQAYTTLEFIYNGTNFIILGNPVVISSSDYTIYPDGKKYYSKEYYDSIYQKGAWTEKTDANDCYYDLTSINIRRTYFVPRTGSSTSNNTPSTYRNWIIETYQSYNAGTAYVINQIAYNSNGDTYTRKGGHSSGATAWNFEEWIKLNNS